MITFITHAKGTTDNSSAQTTAADTTGSSLIVVGVSSISGVSYSVSDSQSNTWTPLMSYSSGLSMVNLFYCENPTTSASHTFRASSGSFMYPVIFMECFSGTASSSSFDQQNGASLGSPGATISPGSITPTASGEVCITLLSLLTSTGTALPITINDSYTATDSQDYATTFGGAMAYLIQTSASATNPTWTQSNTGAMVATIASFKASGGPPPAPNSGFFNLM